MMNEVEIKNKAIEMKRQHGQIDVVKLANALGIVVYGADLDDDVNSWIEYEKEENQFCIVVNKNHSPQRQYFSISHEIGHFVLHNDQIKEKGKVGRQDEHSLTAKEEQEADELGAEILMPKELIREYAKDDLKIQDNTPVTQKIIKQIARYFDVSKEASIMRMRNLGYYVPYISFG